MKISIGAMAAALVVAGTFWAGVTWPSGGARAFAEAPPAATANGSQTPNKFEVPMSYRLGEILVEPWAGSDYQRYGCWQSGPRLQSLTSHQDRGEGCLDAEGNLYFSSGGLNRVLVVTPEATKFLAGTGCRGNRGDGLAEEAWFDLRTYDGRNQPAVVGRPLSGKGALYVADGGNRLVWKIYRKGDGRFWCERFAGGGERPLSESQKASAGQIAISPQSVAADLKGEVLYIAGPSEFLRVRLADGTAERLPSIPEPRARQGTISMPWYLVACDAAGNVYGMDRRNNYFRYSPGDGRYERVAGPGKGGMVDGPVLEASFWCPCCLAVDPRGFFYTGGGDESNIRRVKDGQCTSLGLDSKFGVYDDANRRTGCYAGSGNCWPLAVDRQGRLYFESGRDGQIWRMTFPEGTKQGEQP